MSEDERVKFCADDDDDGCNRSGILFSPKMNLCQAYPWTKRAEHLEFRLKLLNFDLSIWYKTGFLVLDQ